MSLPSLNFFRSSPPTEVLRIESEPPGADARIAEGQSCRTPCELTVPANAELAVSFALPGYQPQTVPVRPEPPAAATSYTSEPPSGTRMQPNPVYAELQPDVPPRPKKKRRARPKKKTVAKKSAPKVAPPPAAAPPPPQQAAPPPMPAQTTTTTGPADYPWPPPPQAK